MFFVTCSHEFLGWGGEEAMISSDDPSHFSYFFFVLCRRRKLRC